MECIPTKDQYFSWKWKNSLMKFWMQRTKRGKRIKIFCKRIFTHFLSPMVSYFLKLLITIIILVYVVSDSPFYYTNVLKALVYHLPGPPRKTIEHGPKRFLKLVQTIEFNDDIIEKVKQLAAAEGKNNLHPFIVIAVTNNLPVAYYLSLFDAIFKFDSFLGAFDILFQSLFVLRISYPEELFSFFTFIQVFFYNINTPNDRTIGNVTKLIKKLDYNRLAWINKGFQIILVLYFRVMMGS